MSQLRSEINPRSWGMSSQNNRFFNKFTLVTPDGCKYVFGGVNATEYSISYYHRNTSDLIATSWFLSEIITPEGRVVKYNYRPSGPQCDIRYASQSKTVYNFQCSSGAYNLSTGRAALTGFLIFPVLLSSIESPNEVIGFNYSDIPQNGNRYSRNYLAWKTPGVYSRFNIYSSSEVFDEPAYQFQLFLNVRTDTESNLQLDVANSLRWEKLDMIKVVPKYIYGCTKNISFNYVYNNRRKISKITEDVVEKKLDSSSGSISPNIVREYNFLYDTTTMPTNYVQAGEDSWGYFNGQTISIASQPDFLFQPPSLKYTKAEVLVEVQYPTKGKVRFDYEQNLYGKIVSSSLNSLQDELGFAGGLRISKMMTLSSSGEILNVKKYYYSDKRDSKGSGVLRIKPLHTWNYYTGNSTDSPYLLLRSQNGFVMPIANMNSPIVSYPIVIQEDLDSIGQSQGYVRFKFSDYSQDIWGESHYDEQSMYSTSSGISFLNQCSSRSMERGKLLQEEYFDAKNNLIKTVSNEYVRSSFIDNFQISAYQDLIFFCTAEPFTYGSVGALTKIYTYNYLLRSRTETLTKHNISNVVNWKFNKQGFVSIEVNTNSGSGDVYSTFYIYPNDLIESFSDVRNSSLDVYRKMVDLNILAVPVETIKKKNGQVTAANLTTYKLHNNWPVKDSEYQLETNSLLNSNYKPLSFADNKSTPLISNEMKIVATYSNYDKYNNPTFIKTREMPYVLIWNYQGQSLAARIHNASYSEVSSVLKTSPESFSENIFSIESAQLLRMRLPHVQVNVYDDLPTTGVMKKITPNGEAIYYEYDFLGRYTGAYFFEGNKKKYIHVYDYYYLNKP